jgi:transcriptional regulator with XRE-family HTH domain
MASQSVERRRQAGAVRRAFGAIFSVCLRAPGMSVSRVAREAHITRAYAQRLAGGKSQPTLSVLLAIADVLATPAPKLVSMTQKKMEELAEDKDTS